MSNRALGNKGEELAVNFLKAKEFVIIERNYTFERSEIDIIARDKETIVFVEVKLRSNARYGYPEEFVDEKKIQFIYRAAEGWMYERDSENTNVRFDVVSILLRDNDQPQITHFIDAFR